ncbi:MAG: chitobiase/beta-hexosaminidase C-terminal domain-containing protein [Eubacterium sp.]|nr:chitobiase/beta-hexosaminidase C-terminal domain-containing protein [Eubacterium sp.]
MRKCTRCGADIPDGDFFCPACGEPVQLVPDYETIESRAQEQELRQKEEEARRQEEERKRALRLAEEAAEKKRIRKARTMLAVFALIAVILAVIVVVVIGRQRKNNSFEYQYRMASEAFEDGRLGEALDYVQKALQIQPDNADAGLLLGMIYEKNGNTEDAEKAYLNVITNNPDFVKAYDSLVPLYAAGQKYDDLQTLLTNIQDEKIREKFKDYITYDVTPSVQPGVFNEKTALELQSEGDGSIYYTKDGTEPAETSLKYQSAIELDEGETMIRARYISPQHIPGSEFTGTYSVQLRRANAPVITPRSGSYSSMEVPKITVEVPTGYTAYYSFDIRADKNSTRYDGPVDMREGSHIFYALLVDQNGKEGDVASATYVYTKLTPTPTPTPNQQRPQSVITPTATPTPTPTPTSTPKPTKTPKPTAEPTEEPTPEPTEAPEPTEEASPDEETDET